MMENNTVAKVDSRKFGVDYCRKKNFKFKESNWVFDEIKVIFLFLKL